MGNMKFNKNQIVLFTEDQSDYWNVIGVGKFLRDCDTNQIKREFEPQLGYWHDAVGKTGLNWSMSRIFPILVEAGWVENLNPIEWNIP